MRYVVLGTSEFTLRCAEGLLEGGAAVTALVSMPSHALPLNSVDVASFAANRKIPYHEVEDVNSAEGVRLLAMHEPDYVFSSWPRILGPDVLALPRLFCIGTHPTELPRGRGRHPLHWLIVLGAEGSKLSFFRMVKGVDAGPILLQVDFGLGASHTVAQVGRSVSEAGYRGARLLAERLQDDPVFEGTPQDDRLAIYWRTRTPHDVTLDPRMSASQISRIVRSFAPPYPGAKLIYEGARPPRRRRGPRRAGSPGRVCPLPRARPRAQSRGGRHPHEGG